MKPRKNAIDKGYIKQTVRILLEWKLSEDCIVKLFNLYPQAELTRAINFFMVKKRMVNEDLFLRYLKNLSEVKGDHPQLYRFNRINL